MPPRNWWLRAFLPVWLTGWALGEIAALITVISFMTGGPRPMSGPLAFLLVWLCGWTIAGAFVIVALAYNVWGRESVTFEPMNVVRRFELSKWGIDRVFERAEMRRLRFSPPVYRPNDFWWTMQPWGFGGGSIAFDYRGRTHRFGQSLEEDESRALIDQISRR